MQGKVEPQELLDHLSLFPLCFKSLSSFSTSRFARISRPQPSTCCINSIIQYVDLASSRFLKDFFTLAERTGEKDRLW
ncbi:MAG: hypothetical protein JWP89_1229 [Schlesneria sp.]|nr:hypothetical protein [Schlesneria sp.]